MNIVNSDNEWGKLKEIIVGRIPNNYLIPVTKKIPFTRDDLKLIQKCSQEVFHQRNL